MRRRDCFIHVPTEWGMAMACCVFQAASGTGTYPVNGFCIWRDGWFKLCNLL